MKKVLTTALAALTLGGAVVATAAPAQAQRYDRGYNGGHRHYDRGRHNDHGDALAAGVVGLALGAALASSGGGRGYSSYGSSYYDRPAAYGYYDSPRYAYRTCISQERVYDPYIGRRVLIERRYAC